MAVIKNRTLIDKSTGEVIHANEIIKRVDPQNFMKAYMIDFMMSLGIIGGKSVKVYVYVLNHMDYRTNKLHQTNSQIKEGMASEGNKVSQRTIMRVLHKLEGTKDSKGKPLLTRHRYGKYGRHSYLMLDPNLISYGSKKRHGALLIAYDKAGANKSNHHAKSKRSAQNKSHSKPTKQTELVDRKYGKAKYSSLYAKKSAKPQVQHSHNANDLMANSPLKEDKQKTAPEK